MLGLALAFAVGHVLAGYTENINWDEFALMHRVAAMVRTGQLQGGGRPGLVELLLAPFVAGCEDPTAAIRQARLLWSLITLGYLASVYFLLLALRRTGPAPWRGAALGVALLALVPVFMRWSLQLRTDQPALLCGALAGVVLLASRRRPWLAALAGMLLALGYLFSQKLLYVGALVLPLSALATITAEGGLGRSLHRRTLLRLLLLAVGIVGVIALYRFAMPLVVRLPARSFKLQSGLDTFAYYRKLFGYASYRAMLSTLVPHLALFALLGPALVVATLRKKLPLTRLLMICGTLLLGLAVGLFHAAAFPYFWMTLGLFPAVALGLAHETIVELFPGAALRRLFQLGLAVLLVLPAMLAALSLGRDTQAVQRESMAFVQRNFAPSDRGFQAEGALFCRADPRPFPLLFSEHIMQRFYGPRRKSEIAAFIGTFRAKPVKFIVATHVVSQFPSAIRRFWRDHFVPYFAGVQVPGAVFEGKRGARTSFDIIVAGRYRWIPFPQDRPIVIDGQTLGSAQTITLQPGPHGAQFVQDAGGALVLALKGPFRPSRTPFYSQEAILEITGGVAPRWSATLRR